MHTAPPIDPCSSSFMWIFVPSGLLWQARTSTLSFWKKSSITYDGIMWIGSTPHQTSRSLTKTPFGGCWTYSSGNQMFKKHTLFWIIKQKHEKAKMKFSACERGAQNKLQSSYLFARLCVYADPTLYISWVSSCAITKPLWNSFPQGILGIVVPIPTGTPEGLWEMSWQYDWAGDGQEIPCSPPGIGRERN